MLLPRIGKIPGREGVSKRFFWPENCDQEIMASARMFLDRVEPLSQSVESFPKCPMSTDFLHSEVERVGMHVAFKPKPPLQRCKLLIIINNSLTVS